MKCATVFPMLIAKTERKERTRETVYRPMCTAQAQRGKCHHAQAECLPVQSLPRTPADCRCQAPHRRILCGNAEHIIKIPDCHLQEKFWKDCQSVDTGIYAVGHYQLSPHH